MCDYSKLIMGLTAATEFSVKFNMKACFSSSAKIRPLGVELEVLIQYAPVGILTPNLLLILRILPLLLQLAVPLIDSSHIYSSLLLWLFHDLHPSLKI